MPQLTRIARINGEDLYLRWPYQATVMKTLDRTRRTIGATAGKGMARPTKSRIREGYDRRERAVDATDRCGIDVAAG
jgi:hypothetical protein